MAENGLEIDKTSTGHTLKAFTFDKDAAVQLPDSKGNVKYQKPIKIDPANTIIMPRGIGTLGFTGSRNWYDMMSMLELDQQTFLLQTKQSRQDKYKGKRPQEALS